MLIINEIEWIVLAYVSVMAGCHEHEMNSGVQEI